MHREYDLISLDALKKVRKKREKKTLQFLGYFFQINPIWILKGNSVHIIRLLGILAQHSLGISH